MKKFMLSMTAFLGTSVAVANNLPYFYEEGFYTTELDIVEGEALGARVTINTLNQSLDLTVDQKWTCPEGQMCAAFMPPPVLHSFANIELNIALYGYCYVPVITAENNGLAYDAPLKKIAVYDYSKSNCEFPSFVPDTVIEYSESGGQMVGEQSTSHYVFKGPELQYSENLPPVVFAGRIEDVSFADGTLYMDITYGGGFKEHEFELDFSNCDVADVEGRRVKRCNVELMHVKGQDDLGRMLIAETREFAFDISAPYIMNVRGIEYRLNF